MTRFVSVEEGMNALRAVVAEAGEDFVYGRGGELYSVGCFYVRNGKPSCLIGRALYKLGVSISQLKAMDGSTRPFFSSAYQIIRGFEFDPILVDAYRRAQHIQDSRGTWGDALHLAEWVINNHYRQKSNGDET